jgi:hypothetical protein
VPSNAIVAKAFRLGLPTTPTINATVDAATHTVTLVWNQDPETRASVERSADGMVWTSIATLPEGLTTCQDYIGDLATAIARYRVRSISPSGKVSLAGSIEVALV